MEKKKWLWKRRSSERSPDESETSGSGSGSGLGSCSSNSERYSDEHDASRESPKGSAQSPEITSKAAGGGCAADELMHETVKSLTEKLSAALVNLSAKEDLVKQHAKVAEEAVAGWEKAESEAAALKQQLEVTMQQNSDMEVRVNHLDGALKECVRQLRQARDNHETRIADAVKSIKSELEKQIVDLQTRADADMFLGTLEKENTFLKQEILSRCKELELIKTERDLITQAAEATSKLQLESIKRVAKLEAECRSLQSAARKSSPVSESLTDSYSDSGERQQAEPSCSDSWASALITELDRFKNDKKLFATNPVEIDMMDDFLEMERLAALPDTKTSTPLIAELEKKLETTEAEKAELERVLEETKYSLGAKLESLQKGLAAANEAKELLESQLVSMDAEARTMSANIKSLQADIVTERMLSTELRRRVEETENHPKSTDSNAVKIKQEDISVAADKLAECQKTIASLGKQLKSLATLEDFLIDTSNIPGFSGACKPLSTDVSSDSESSATSRDNLSRLENGNGEASPSLLCLSAVSGNANQTGGGKGRNGFGKFFSRSKTLMEVSHHQE